jgi:hypothetical protein
MTMSQSQIDTSNAASPYSELERLQAVRDRSQTIGEFLDWLCHEKNVLLVQSVPVASCLFKVSPGDSYQEWPFYCPIQDSYEELLAEYFNIDLKKVSSQKAALLASLRGEA